MLSPALSARRSAGSVGFRPPFVSPVGDETASPVDEEAGLGTRFLISSDGSPPGEGSGATALAGGGGSSAKDPTDCVGAGETVGAGVSESGKGAGLSVFLSVFAVSSVAGFGGKSTIASAGAPGRPSRLWKPAWGRAVQERRCWSLGSPTTPEHQVTIR